MTGSMLIEAMDEPFDVDETVYKTKTKLKYFYKPYITRQKLENSDSELTLKIMWLSVGETLTNS